MVGDVRWFLSLQAIVFGAASMVHSGVVMRGYEHREAAIAESVIGLVLLLGLAASVMAPRASRAAGLAAQGFALLGTLVGMVTIAIGIGPRTAFDVALHLGMIALLVAGLVRVARSPRRA